MENTLEINFLPKQSRAKENTEATANVSPGTNTAYDCERDGHDWREGTAVGFFYCVRCGRKMAESERFESISRIDFGDLRFPLTAYIMSRMLEFKRG